MNGGVKTGGGALKLNKWLAWLLIFLGGILVASGIVFVFMYVWEAIISRFGEPDQSLIFWYLPILFIGLFLGMGGRFLIALGMQRKKCQRN